MNHKELSELESSFDSCFCELIYQLKQAGMNRDCYALLSGLYRTLSAQIGTQLDLISLDEQPVEN